MARNTLTLPDAILHRHSRKVLISKYKALYGALDRATRSLKTATLPVHAFSRRGEEAYLKAALEHAKRIYQLERVRKEVSDITWHLAAMDDGD